MSAGDSIRVGAWVTRRDQWTEAGEVVELLDEGKVVVTVNGEPHTIEAAILKLADKCGKQWDSRTCLGEPGHDGKHHDRYTEWVSRYDNRCAAAQGTRCIHPEHTDSVPHKGIGGNIWGRYGNIVEGGQS